MTQQLILRGIQDINSCAFAFLPWRRERCGLPEEDWRWLHRIAFDLLRLDAAQMLKEAGHPQFLATFVDFDDSLIRRLMSDPMRSMALHLGLSNHNRLVFQAACGVAADPVLQTYATAALPASALSDAQAKAIWNTYQDFLKQWVFSPVFLALFTLPYKTALTLSAELEPVWTRFLAELSSLVRLVEQAWKPPAGYRFLRFWLSRVHEAKCWPPGEEYRRLQNACAACWQYDNPDSNRVLTYADY